VVYTETEVLLTNLVPTPGTLGLAGLAMVAGLGRRRE